MQNKVKNCPQFTNTGKARLFGSSFSSGIFVDQSGQEWYGKAEYCTNENISEAIAYKEKIAADIYTHYGVTVPRIAISRQKMTNTGMDDEFGNVYTFHTMSEILPGFKTYQEVCGKEFCATSPNPGQYIVSNDTKTPETGLGHILAVASLINDVDAIGFSGGNIGFTVERKEDGGIFAKTIKIDLGEAFHPNLSLQEKRSIRVALPQSQTENSQLKFENLPQGTQTEFMMSLHDITKSNEATLKKFFALPEKHNFVLYFDRSVEDLTKILLTRQKQLLEDYKEELNGTEEEYKIWNEKRKSTRISSE